MRRSALVVTALLGCFCFGVSVHVVAGSLAYVDGCERLLDKSLDNVEDHEATSSFSRRYRFFMDAQSARQRRDFQLASALYDAVVASGNNAMLAEQQLRMWAQYQHADLLMRVPASLTNRSIATTKQQAIRKFQDAIRLSEMNSVADTSPRFGVAERVHAFNSLGLLAIELHELDHAEVYFHRAIETNNRATEPLGNLAILYLKMGRFDRALETNARALDLQPQDARLVQNMGTIFYGQGREREAQVWWEYSLMLDPSATEAMASLATLYGSRGDAGRARELLSRAVDVAAPGLIRNSYRLQLAMTHFEMIYASAEAIHTARTQFETALKQLQDVIDLPDPLGTIGSGSMGYYVIYQGFDDKRIRQQVAQIYLNSARDTLAFTTDHVAAAKVAPSHRRLRIGFLSAFWYHHSVGLLLSGVIRHLPRDVFDVYVLTFDTARRDPLTQQLEEVIDPKHWIVLPEQSLRRAQELVAPCDLDVLVFGEIGMHAATYFLAFARLAHRTVQFWGHAITSGVPTVDYFVSSTLFRRNYSETRDQERYAECLYEMDGLTTLFPQPPAPHTGFLRISFGLPDERTMPHMVLVPQTLYKLHPDFDTIIQGVLSRVNTSFLVLLTGDKPLLVKQLTRRWRQAGILDESVYKRIFFVRRLNETEFLALCELADVVLDPFPVGGGRSSFEVFCVNTPILGLTPRTTILQLTLGMYRRMGIDPSCCMFEVEDDLVDRAVELLRDDKSRRHLRQQIEVNKHKLYEASNARVVREWTTFLHRIISNDAPTVSDCETTRHCPQWTPTELPRHLVYESVVNPAPSVHALTSTPKLLRLYDDQDPFDVARAFVPDDELQAAYLGKLLWNAQQRFRHRVVDTFVVRLRSSGAACSFEIRDGDDLHQTIRFQLRQHHLHPLDAVDHVEQDVLAVAKRRLPNHSSPAWRNARALAPPRVFPVVKSPQGDSVALVVTTCNRLALFRRTIHSLAHALEIHTPGDWRRHFSKVLVVDDNSSDADRAAMQSEFPTFTFLWKTPLQTGHATSLNLALERLKSVRFLLYLEDDWEFRRDATRTFVEDAVAILRATPLVQVLLNDQRSGYATELTTPTGRVVPYAIHEFAILDPAHTFAYWPGFSLNPGVLDLARLSVVLQHEPFDPDSDVFERAFALRMWRAGLATGYFHGRVLCDHIGAHASAYVLNDCPRRFD